MNGVQRERDVLKRLREDGWIATRTPASKGSMDIIALRAGETPMLVQVKATARGPFSGFPPAERAELRQAAEQAGADPVLAWWPKRKSLKWIPSTEWPS